MTTVFIHDHVFIKNSSSYFSEGKLTNKTWERYLCHDSPLLIVGRVKNSKVSSSKYSLASMDKVHFNCLNSISIKDRIYPKRIDDFLINVISNSNYVICRLPSFLGRRAFKVAKELNKKILIEVVGCPFDALINHGSLSAKFLAFFEKRVLKKILDESDYAIYVTNRFLQTRYPTKGKSFSISNVELHNSDIRCSIRKNAHKIAFIGSLNTKYKGLSDLIDAFIILKKDHPKLELHVLGGGNKEIYLNRINSNNLSDAVYFYEPIKGGVDVLKWLSLFDLYVQPSHTEGLPRALIEAMSIGLPCIGSAVGGIPELLNEKSLFKSKDVQQLAYKIKILIKDFQLRLELSGANRETSRSYSYLKLSNARHSALSEFFTK